MDHISQTSSESSLKALKLLFFAMMLILIGGAVFLFVTIYDRNQVKSAPHSCENGTMTIPVRANIHQMSKDGDVITVLTEMKKNTQEIVVFNYCTGKIIRSVLLHKTPGE